MIERVNYKLSKSENPRVSQCQSDKEKEIKETIKYFGMISYNFSILQKRGSKKLTARELRAKLHFWTKIVRFLMMEFNCLNRK